MAETAAGSPSQPYAPRTGEAVAAPKVLPITMPDRVMVALNFIDHCNQNMGLRGFAVTIDEYTTESKVEYAELHPAQEATFRAACEVVNAYFHGKDQPRAGKQTESKPVQPAFGGWVTY